MTGGHAREIDHLTVIRRGHTIRANSRFRPEASQSPSASVTLMIRLSGRRSHVLRSRRGFFDVLAGGASPGATAALLAARGHEAYVAELQAQGRTPRPPLPPGVDEIRLSSNENPLGPGRKVLDAILRKFPEAGRYPFNSTPADSNLVAAIAAHHKVKPENVVLGAGSQEI